MVEPPAGFEPATTGSPGAVLVYEAGALPAELRRLPWRTV